tara:strand:+ start:1906 stop:2160 length:255 start_codon:yes stop_codon:yes gene_type:complete
MIYSPMLMAIGVAFTEIFLLRMFLAQVGASNLIWSGIKALGIAAITVLLILLLATGYWKVKDKKAPGRSHPTRGFVCFFLGAAC